ncbi:hypothetical protein [Chamaesiphon sp. GL140_3_metabinner_50]|uniref:hypothetical protein n=1 Tax=Chamaesiphon sp. GL140_3_metabinner_50 TaxID=2970812 RepID=UPI0025CBB87E|nr:hypothetical protein [Chamaesiphon sp. GL140_3_metabinner_50]
MRECPILDRNILKLNAPARFDRKLTLCRKAAMLELNTIAEFSRSHCIEICAFLVPISLLLTTTTMLLVGLDRSSRLIYASICVAILPPIVLFLHVATWWSIGVVMLPTFILPVLATICLATNAYALIAPKHMRNLLIIISKFSIAKYQQLVAN